MTVATAKPVARATPPASVAQLTQLSTVASSEEQSFSVCSLEGPHGHYQAGAGNGPSQLPKSGLRLAGSQSRSVTVPAPAWQRPVLPPLS